MQEFESGNRDSLAPDEAREVLQAWANRRQASGVDAGVNSISALAAGLGVSEDEVRRMVEDIRVHQRSQQIAAGILTQENARRKNLDVTAAIGAAIAFIVVALAAGAFFITRTKVSGPTTVITPVVEGIPTPPAPPAAISTPGAMHIETDDGSVIDINGAGVNVKSSDGSITSVAQASVRAQLMRQISELEKQKAEVRRASIGRDMNPGEAMQIQLLDAQIKGLQKRVDKMAKPAAVVTGR